MEQTDLVMRLCEEFNLGEPIRCTEIGGPGRGILELGTGNGRYVLKRAKDFEAAELYAQVEVELNSKGIKQARIYRSLKGSLTGASNYSVFEFLEGESAKELSEKQRRSSIEYMAGYNSALAHIPLARGVLALNDPWNRAVSPTYLAGDLRNCLDSASIEPVTRAIAMRCTDFMAESRILTNGSQQLIHGDIGPGNILFLGDSVVSVIDFSPHAAKELYSLCQFFYWHYLTTQELSEVRENVMRCLEIYSGCRDGFSVQAGELHATFVLAAAYRLVGPLLATMDGVANFSNQALAYRANLLQSVLDTKLFS